LPNIWALWGSEVTPIVIFVSSQCIALEFSFQQSFVYVETVYASTSYVSLRQLWAELTRLQGCFQGPWLFHWDFNVVMEAHEKCGCRPPPSVSCLDFVVCLDTSFLRLLFFFFFHFRFYSWRILA